MLFPELQGKRFSSTDLDREARELGLGEENALLDPEMCQKFVEDCHRRYKTDFSYGGWLELRSTLWRGSYLDEAEHYVHLGIDFNVPAGTAVAAPRACLVIRIDNDFPDVYGWGNRIIVHDAEMNVMVIYAHLDTPTGVKVGDSLKPGQVFARVGDASKNGGWFPHLHVQLVVPEQYERLLQNDLRDLDGYGHIRDIEMLKIYFPDPLEYLGDRF